MARRTGADLLALGAAPLFVVLWSTGFIGAKYGLPHIEPLTFLAIRFVLALAILAVWVRATRSAWPSAAQAGHLFLVGALLHGVYLGGVFSAISLGTEAGLAALIVSMQPLTTALLARPLLGERLTHVQHLGLAIGFAGVALVVARKLGDGIGDWRGVALCLLSLTAISAATLYQKRFGAEAPLRSGTLIQYAGAFALVTPLALALESQRIVWSGELVFAMGWLVLVLSIGAVGLLMVLIRQGAASKVASLFFLVPPSTAILAWAIFGETLGPLAVLGMVLAITGVALVMRGGARPPARAAGPD